MPATPSQSQQILVEEIVSFVDALRRRGSAAVSGTIRSYILFKMGAGRLDPALDPAGTESFLNRLNYFVSRETVTWESRVPLLAFLLEVDAHGKLLDVYHENRARTHQEIHGLDAMERVLKRYATTRLDELFARSQKGATGAAEEFLHLFTETSFEVAKHLFEEAERRFVHGSGAEGILPEVVVRLEQRMFQPGVPEAEAQAILDRASYLFARLPIDTLRRIDEAARAIKTERGLFPRLRPYQTERVQEYLAFLDRSLGEVQRSPTLSIYLRRINEKKAVINGWDRMLMVHIDVRLGLKQYHNAITQDLIRRSREIEVDLRESQRLAPTAEGSRIQAELHFAIEQRQPVATVVEKAVAAEELLRSAKQGDEHAARLKAEVIDKLKVIDSEFNAAFDQFDAVIDAIRLLVNEARSLRQSYKSLVSQDDELRTAIDALRSDINDRLQKGIERLKLPSPVDTTKIYQATVRVEEASAPTPPEPHAIEEKKPRDLGEPDEGGEDDAAPFL